MNYDVLVMHREYYTRLSFKGRGARAYYTYVSSTPKRAEGIENASTPADYYYPVYNETRVTDRRWISDVPDWRHGMCGGGSGGGATKEVV